MISTISLGLAVYQGVALLTGLPRISKLASDPRWGVLICAWLAWLVWHFIQEARHA